MTTIEQVVSSSPGLIASIAGFIGMWFKFQNKVERLEEDKIEIRRQNDALWKWKDSHEREVSESRERVQKELSRLEGMNLVVSEQFKQIMSYLQDIKERVVQLEHRN